MTAIEHAAPVAIEHLRASLQVAESERHAAFIGEVFGTAPSFPADFVTAKERRDFWALDIGTSGAFMVRKADGAIFGIKGYGTPDYRKGIAYLGEMDAATLLTYRHKRGPFRTDMKAVGATA